MNAQQDYLRDAAATLELTQKQLAVRMCAPWAPGISPFRPTHHGPQDYQSLLMHLEAVRMIHRDPALADKALAILARWNTHVNAHSKPLRDRWVQILEERDWALAVEDSELGKQLRQASPMACLLPNDVRLAIIAQVRLLKDECGVPTMCSL